MTPQGDLESKMALNQHTGAAPCGLQAGDSIAGRGGRSREWAGSSPEASPPPESSKTGGPGGSASAARQDAEPRRGHLLSKPPLGGGSLYWYNSQE